MITRVLTVVEVWLRGFLVGLLGGAVVVFSLTVSSDDPLVVFVVSGGLVALAYFKQSPIPPGWDGTERRHPGRYS